MLTLAHPLFLLAGQALYYSDKSMRVNTGERVCVWVCVCYTKKAKMCADLSQACRGSHLPKLALIASLIPKAIRDSAASSLSFNHSLHH